MYQPPGSPVQFGAITLPGLQLPRSSGGMPAGQTITPLPAPISVAQTGQRGSVQQFPTSPLMGQSANNPLFRPGQPVSTTAGFTPIGVNQPPVTPMVGVDDDSSDRKTALSTLLYQYGKPTVDRLINLRLVNGEYLIQNITFVDNFTEMVSHIGLEQTIDTIVNGSGTVGKGTVLIEGKVEFPDVRVPVDNYGKPLRSMTRLGQSETTPGIQTNWESPSDPFVLANTPYLERMQRTFITTTESGRIKTSVKGGALCPNCQSDNTFFRLDQLRSADEPVTAIYKCKNCGRTWKKG